MRNRQRSCRTLETQEADPRHRAPTALPDPLCVVLAIPDASPAPCLWVGPAKLADVSGSQRLSRYGVPPQRLSHAGCERASSQAPAGFRGNNVRPLPRAPAGPARPHSSAFGSAPPRCAAEKEGGEGGGRLTAHDCLVAPAVTVPSTLSQRAWRRLESCRSTPPVRCSGQPGPSHRLTAGGREREREGEEEGRSERKRGS